MRKIKQLKIILPLALCFVLSACGGIRGKGTDAKNSSQMEDAQTQSVKYSNLVDEETRKRVAKALKQARAKVIIGDIDKENGKMTANELDGDFYYLDVTDKEQVQYVVQSIYEKYGKLSILCSNAGIFPQVSIENMTEKRLG